MTSDPVRKIPPKIYKQINLFAKNLCTFLDIETCKVNFKKKNPDFCQRGLIVRLVRSVRCSRRRARALPCRCSRSPTRPIAPGTSGLPAPECARTRTFTAQVHGHSHASDRVLALATLSILPTTIFKNRNSYRTVLLTLLLNNVSVYRTASTATHEVRILHFVV